MDSYRKSHKQRTRYGEDRENSGSGRNRQGNNDRETTVAPPTELPPEIKNSIDQIRPFFMERMNKKCHFCNSGLTESFSARAWLDRWAQGAYDNPQNSCFLCAATCHNCEQLTCLGCGKEPIQPDTRHEVNGYHLGWCCRDGRLFGMWLMLVWYDALELQMQTSSTSSAVDSAALTGRRGGKSSKLKTQDSRGIGYADKSVHTGNPFVPLFYDGPGAPPIALRHAIKFEVADTRTDRSVAAILGCLNEMIPGPSNKNLPLELSAMFRLSLLLDKVADLLRNDSLDDCTKRSNIYHAAIELVCKLSAHPELIGLVQGPRYHKQQTPGLEAISSTSSRSNKNAIVLGEKIPSLGERFKLLAKQSEIVLSAARSPYLSTRDARPLLDLCEDISAVYRKIATEGGQNHGNDGLTRKVDKWEVFHQEHGVLRDENVVSQDHAYYNEAMRMTYSRKGRMKRLVTEVANMVTSLPAGIFVKVGDSRPDVMRCLIMGPPDSPYGYALFDFDLFCPAEYPLQPPLVKCRSSRGRIINPNLHPDGKVCLSLLGTWHDGDAAAQWQPGKSTVLSVLISIQAMIFNEDPWRNEPAFTSAVGSRADQQAKKYVAKIQPHVIIAGMLDWLFKPIKRNGIWKEEVHAHFTMNRGKIVSTVKEWARSNPSLVDKGYLPTLMEGLENINRE
ncbi:hypothetical protein FQN57_003832 [Myotisia sp. PD_48]|nr:hypothetical protein FQN57_003832 [Myotisia sp. PD_48]